MRTFLGQLMCFSVSPGRKRCKNPESSIPTQTSGMKNDFTVSIASRPAPVTHRHPKPVGLRPICCFCYLQGTCFAPTLKSEMEQRCQNRLEMHAGLEVLCPSGSQFWKRPGTPSPRGKHRPRSPTLVIRSAMPEGSGHPLQRVASVRNASIGEKTRNPTHDARSTLRHPRRLGLRVTSVEDRKPPSMHRGSCHAVHRRAEGGRGCPLGDDQRVRMPGLWASREGLVGG